MSFENNQNFSHPHVLHHLKLDEQKSFPCDACQESIITTELFHGCPSCEFHLHSQCFNAPLHLQHPSHTSHTLTLLPNTTYSARSFTCDACGFDGNGACYHCSACDYDIHLRCANLPTSFLVNEHQHALTLFLTSPYNDSNLGFQCDFCHGMKENKLWSYYCRECDFGIHVGCAMKFKEATDSENSLSMMRQMLSDQQALDAAIIKAKISKKARDAILGHHRRRRPGAYFSDSSDDGLI